MPDTSSANMTEVASLNTTNNPTPTAAAATPRVRSLGPNRTQTMLQNNQPSFRVQALVGRHGGNHNNASNANDMSLPRATKSNSNSSFRVPRLNSSRKLLGSSWHNSSTSHNGGLHSSSISGSIPDFGNSIRITDLEDSSASCMFLDHSNGYNNHNNNNNPHSNSNNHLLEVGSTTSSRWGQQSVKFRANNFVASQNASLDAHYHVGELLGEGGFGEVYQCTHIQSGEDQRAVKVIAKHESSAEENVKLIAEFDIVKDLDHPNILRLYALYESDSHFFLVTDLYAGGELYDELEEFGRFNEDDAALLMNQVLSCLNYCHHKKLAHRDLKPENILLEGNKNFEDLKIIDFGLAAYGDHYTELEGSTYYMSPQVIEGHYNHKCDIWSVGVIAYVCLAGFAPFDGETEQDVIQSILCGKVDFEDSTWDDVSEEAMDFIAYLLTYEEEHRPTAGEALQHPWLQGIRQRNNRSCSKRRESTKMSLGNLQTFQANSKLKQCVCSLIASQFLKKHEKEEIDTVFRSLDHDCDGKLTREDVETSYKEFFGRTLSKEDLDSMFAQVNFSGSGAIEYSEFVVASLMEKNLIDDFKLMAAFKIFDKKNKGYIDVEDLKQVLDLDDDMDGYILNVIVRQVDDNGDGKISFDEFKDMMFCTAVIPPKPSNKGRLRRSDTDKHSNVSSEGGGTPVVGATSSTATPYAAGSSLSSAAQSQSTHHSLRNRVVVRGNRSTCSSNISLLSADSISMASSAAFTITEEDLMDDSIPKPARGGRQSRQQQQQQQSDDMSFNSISNMSFAHVYQMFDDKNKQQHPKA